MEKEKQNLLNEMELAGEDLDREMARQKVVLKSREIDILLEKARSRDITHEQL